MANPLDTWDWSVDDVVNAFCHERTLWQDERPNSSFPDPAAFESVLREQDINGATLLCDVTSQLLKDEFGVKTIGQRSSITWAIEKLRRKSRKYLQQCPPPFLPPSAPASSYAPATPFLPYNMPQPDIYSPPPSHRQSATSKDGHAGSSASFMRPDPMLCHQDAPGDAHSPIQDDGHASRDTSGFIVSPSKRAGESLVDDGTGRKRRRLDLNVKSPKVPSDAEEARKDNSRPNPQAVEDISIARKSIFLEGKAKIYASSSLHLRSKLSGLPIGHPASYLGKAKLTADEVFFGVTKIRQVLNNDVEMTPLTEDRCEPGTSFEYVGWSTPVYGRQTFIRRMLTSYLSQRPELEIDTSEDKIAFYPHSLSAASGPRSLVQVRLKDDQVIATREHRVWMSESENDRGENDAAEGTEWEYLQHWNAEDDTVLPGYGDSDDESDGELDSLEAEIVADQLEDQAMKKKHLTPEAIASVIEEAMKEQISSWRTKRLPVLRDQKALSIWRKGETSIFRAQLAGLAQQRIHKHDGLINKITAEIAKNQWDSEVRLRKQCESVDEVVKQREEERFRLSVYQQRTAPAPPSNRLNTFKRGKRPVHNDCDELDLDSDEELVLGDEPSGNFISIDDLPVLDLTEVPDTAEPEPSAGQQQGTDDVSMLRNEDVMGSGKSQRSDEDGMDDDTESDSVIGSERDHISSAELKHHLVKQEDRGKSADEPANKHAPNYVDLTLDTTDDEALTPVRIPSISHRTKAVAKEKSWSSHPKLDPDEVVETWKWDELEDEDPLRIVILLVRTIPGPEYKRLREYVLEEDEDETTPKIRELAENAGKILHQHQGQSPPFQMASHAYDRADEMLHLWICSLEKSAKYFRDGYERNQEHFQLVELDEHVVEAALKQLDADEGTDMMICFADIRDVLKMHTHPLGDHFSSDSEVEETDQFENSQFTPRKRRKRQIAESQAAVSKRNRHKETAEAWEDRSRNFLSQQAAQSSDLVGMLETVVVNPGKKPDEEAIFIPQYLAQSLKPHQIDGIRFMWREVVGTANEGCLLAHTMGLGKTMQVIAFLSTLAHAITSSSEKILGQIPKKLHKLRALMLCPAGLINNWEDEFSKWSKHDTVLGARFTITAQTPSQDRLRLLDRWHREKGTSVLLMGYELYRTWALNPKQGQRTPIFSEAEHKVIKDKLLRGPTVVIADEAHKLKNHESQITRAAATLQTKSRVALTGSPLSNNLLEYFAMVDWISPGYLGLPVEFKANFVEPIEDGMYLGCTFRERRKARIQLLALIRILKDKIHRREIDVLRDDLHGRIQFVLKVPMTSAQAEIYRTFVRLAEEEIGSKVSNAKLWGYMAYLQLLCSHPTLFNKAVMDAKEKARSAQEKKKKTAGRRSRSPKKRDQLKEKVDDGDEVGNLSDCSEATIAATEDGNAPSDSESLQVAAKVLSQLTELFSPILADPFRADLSHKTKLLLDIVKMSLAMKDKVLIFSHRIPTLDHLSRTLQQARIRCARLDGSTQTTKRQQMTKSFNEGDEYDVFLISTRAGGVGFNLHGANRVILFDFSFNPTYEEQAIGRAFRLGQTKPVYVYRFISAGTFEEELFNQTIFKLQLAYQVVEKKNTRSKAVRVRDYIKMPEESSLKDLRKEPVTDKILDTIISNLEPGNESIHDLNLDTIFKEEFEEALDDEDRRELELVVQANQERNADPEGWQAKMLAARQRLNPPPATASVTKIGQTAQPAFNSSAGRQTFYAPPAPIASSVPAARSVGPATSIPPAARFPPVPQEEHHGLPYPGALEFTFPGHVPLHQRFGVVHEVDRRTTSDQ